MSERQVARDTESRYGCARTVFVLVSLDFGRRVERGGSSLRYFHTVVPVQVQSVTSCPTVRVIYSMLLRVCVACVDGFGVGARCGMAGKTGKYPNNSNGGQSGHLGRAVQDLVLRREHAGRGLGFHDEPSRWLGYDKYEIYTDSHG